MQALVPEVVEPFFQKFLQFSDEEYQDLFIRYSSAQPYIIEYFSEKILEYNNEETDLFIYYLMMVWFIMQNVENISVVNPKVTKKILKKSEQLQNDLYQTYGNDLSKQMNLLCYNFHQSKFLNFLFEKILDDLELSFEIRGNVVSLILFNLRLAIEAFDYKPVDETLMALSEKIIGPNF